MKMTLPEIPGESDVEYRRRYHHAYYLKTHPTARRQIKRPKGCTITKEFITSNIIIRPDTGCWEWKLSKSRGYGIAWECGKIYRISRKAYELWKGPIPEGLWALHKCDNPPCCNPDHIFLGNNTDNMRDSVEKGRFHPQAKLTPEQVNQIRSDQRVAHLLAEEYRVSLTAIYSIWRGKTYTWVVNQT